jgi:diguanylate cyclase (GGDEF)-like protein
LRLLHPDDAEATMAGLDAYLRRKTAGNLVVEYRLRHKDGTWRWVMDRGHAVWDERGVAIRMAGSYTDITERKAAESVLTLQARTDALTGVANRREFERLFGEQFRRARSTAEPLTVCICDLDRLKEINDCFGHAAGDRVLISLAGILKKNLRKSDVLARIGGDEFVMSLPYTSAAQATVLMDRMRQELRSLSFESNAGPFTATSSFGIVELQSEHRDSDQLLADADRLLYDAKGSGRDRTLAAEFTSAPHG